MRIKILSNSALQALKENVKADLYLYEDDSPNALLEEVGEEALIDTGLEIPDFRLIVSEDSKQDFYNVKKVYGAMRNVLSPSMASDERLWAGMAFEENCWNYINARWKRDGWTKDSVKDHFFFNHSSRRSLTRNALSRLWWIGYLTYDEKNQEDPWHYTRFICGNQRYIVDVLERNMSNNLLLIKACVNACESYISEAPGHKLDSKDMRDIQKYLSILGGVYVIDTLDISYLENKIYSQIVKIKSKQEEVSDDIN